MADLNALTEAVKAGNRTAATASCREAIDAGEPAQKILDALVAAMDDVGQRFQRNEIYVPAMLVASRAMKECMALLEPLLVKAGIKPAFTAVIGTVQGDLHDIGKNVVAMMWRGANFGVVDLGTNVSPEKFASVAKEQNARVVGLSALLTTTMPAMKTTVAAIRAAGLNDTVIVVGGAPISEEYAKEIGADAYAADAAGAVDVVRKLVAV